MSKEEKNICGFCGKEVKVSKLVPVNDGTGIKDMCPKCRKQYNIETEDDIYEEIAQKIVAPVDFVELLNKKVKGQDQAKKALAVAVHSHYTRVCNSKYLKEMDKPFEKSNIIMTGPSGTGKTLLAKTMAELLDVPFVIANSTSLSETGYVGNDVESILTRLLKAADMNVKRAECGIVFIDEIDKKAIKGENTSITRDVSGEGVQSALLKMIEGCQIGVPKNEGRIHPHEKLIEMDTSNILFICGGAFVGIEDIVRKRLNIPKKNSARIGFGNSNNIELSEDDMTKFLRKKVNHRDLEKFGMIKEFLGRLPIVCNLEPLTREDIMEILHSKYGIIEEYKTYFELQRKSIEFTDEALDMLADGAVDKGFGARGLRGILAGSLRDIMFYAPSEDKVHYEIGKEDLQDYLYEYYMEYTNAIMAIESFETEHKKIDKLFYFTDEVKKYMAREVYENHLEINELKKILSDLYHEFEIGTFLEEGTLSLMLVSRYFEEAQTKKAA